MSGTGTCGQRPVLYIGARSRGRTTNNFYPVCVVPKMIALGRLLNPGFGLARRITGWGDSRG
jgi:hypothetical protein